MRASFVVVLMLLFAGNSAHAAGDAVAGKPAFDNQSAACYTWAAAAARTSLAARSRVERPRRHGSPAPPPPAAPPRRRARAPAPTDAPPAAAGGPRQRGTAACRDRYPGLACSSSSLAGPAG